MTGTDIISTLDYIGVLFESDKQQAVVLSKSFRDNHRGMTNKMFLCDKALFVK